MGRSVHQHQSAHRQGIVRHVTVIALRVTHPQCQRPIGGVELWQIGIVLPEQAVEERHARLDDSFLVHPHPAAVELGPYRLRGDNWAAAAPLRECPMTILAVFRLTQSRTELAA